MLIIKHDSDLLSNKKEKEMKNLKTLERLQQLHKLIDQENTGTPKNIANLMKISERMVHHLIDELKVMSAKICYSRKRQTYYYCEDFDLNVTISVTVMSNNEVTQIFGGSYFLKPQKIFIQVKNITL